MTQRSNVLPAVSEVSEGDFHNAMIIGLSRAQQELGSQKLLARYMDLSTKQVGNIMAGGSTDPKRLWDVHFAVPSALDEIAKLYGVRVVPDGAICTTDKPLAPATCALLRKAIDAETDGVTSHTELLGMEHELREMRALIDARLARIAALRMPRAA